MVQPKAGVNLPHLCSTARTRILRTFHKPPQPSSKSAEPKTWSYPGQKCLSHQWTWFNGRLLHFLSCVKHHILPIAHPSGTVHPFGFPWMVPIPTCRRAERSHFLTELKDTPCPHPHGQAEYTARVSENGKEPCDSAFNVCCFSMPSSVFVSWGCAQSPAKKRFWVTLRKSSSTVSRELVLWDNTKKQKALWSS